MKKNISLILALLAMIGICGYIGALIFQPSLVEPMNNWLANLKNSSGAIVTDSGVTDPAPKLEHECPYSKGKKCNSDGNGCGGGCASGETEAKDGEPSCGGLKGGCASGGMESTGAVENIDPKQATIDEQIENYGGYSDFIQKESEGIKFRVAKQAMDIEVNKMVLDESVTPVSTEKLGTINLFSVSKDEKFSSAKDVIEKYFIEPSGKDDCVINSIDTNKSESKDLSDRIFSEKSDWEVYKISLNSSLNDEKREGIIDGGKCFGIFRSSPGFYFVFNKGDYSRFVVFTKTQDPYPFNPRSLEF